MAAILCCGTRYDHRINTPLPQDNVQISAKKTAVAMFVLLRHEKDVGGVTPTVERCGTVNGVGLNGGLNGG